jgi:hypothetical protein
MPAIPATEECRSSRSRLEAAGGVVSEVEGVKTPTNKLGMVVQACPPRYAEGMNKRIIIQKHN